jgi:hypothetical protein
MLAPHGFRSLWPALQFTPWLALGLAFLLRSARSPLRRASIWGLAVLAAAQIALADPASQPRAACAVTDAQEARTLADKLFEKGEYQHAGACYEAAGDMARANLAFLKAAGPASEESARALKAQTDHAAALFAAVGRAFQSNH